MTVDQLIHQYVAATSENQREAAIKALSEEVVWAIGSPMPPGITYSDIPPGTCYGWKSSSGSVALFRWTGKHEERWADHGWVGTHDRPHLHPDGKLIIMENPDV